MSSERLIIGAAQLGQPYGRGAHRKPPAPETVGRWLDAAAAAGVAGIDTARAYGDSEALIGAARTEPNRVAIPIMTKIRPLTELDGESPPELVEDAVRASLAESLTALRTDAVDTVMLHRARDLRAGAGRAVAVLDELRREGAAGRWGVSIGAPEELFEALDHPRLGFVQLPYNLLDRRWYEPEVQAALEARPDVTIGARSTYLQGVLVDPLSRSWPGPNLGDAAELATRLEWICRELGRESLRDLAVGYVLGHPWVSAVVVGARSPEQIEDTARLVGRGPLTPAEIDWLRSEIPAGPIELIDPSRWPPPPRKGT